LTGFNAAVGSVRFTPNGRVLIAGSLDYATDFDGMVTLWDVADIHRPRLLSTIHPGIGGIKDLEVSPDGRTLALAGTSARLALVDISAPATPRGRSVLAGHRYDVATVSFSPDGRTLASGSSDRTIRLWDITTPDRPAGISTITGFTSALITIAFSRDGRTLAVGSFDTKVALWDVTDRRAPRALPSIIGLGAGVNSIEFSSDGRLMAAGVGGANGVVRLWDMSDPADPVPYATFSGRYNGFAAVAFAPDTAFIVGAPYQVIGFVWDLDPASVVTRLCARAGDPLTREEWKQYLPGLDYDPPCG
jgi:WD40 repeat protein